MSLPRTLTLPSTVPSNTRAGILIVGGGLGGVAAALAATDAGCRVVLTEETDWLGGQMTSQAVPPDEHPWIERFGRTRRYAELRERIRAYYRRNFRLSPQAMSAPFLNPGGGTVSGMCHLPHVSASVMEEMLAPALLSGRLEIVRHAVPIAVDATEGRLRAVRFLHLDSGREFEISAAYVLDATELGDLLPLAGIDYVSGAESQSETGEPHAVAGPAQPDNVQALTWCFPLAYDPSRRELREDDRIEPPPSYAYWRDYVPELTPRWSGKLFSLCYSKPQTCEPLERPLFPTRTPAEWNFWYYRRILSRDVFADADAWSEVTLVNWPQNDFLEGNLIDCEPARRRELLESARQLSLSLAHWLQNEIPRPDGGCGYPGFHLRPDLSGTPDGLAKAPYIRESRRIRALTTVTENHIGVEARENRWPDPFDDSVGVGSYRIDLHPSANGRNYIDISSYPFQIPLGALIPRACDNLIAAAKNIGTTHISNGCYRLHPVEWNIGEAAGALAAFCIGRGLLPRDVRGNRSTLRDFQQLLVRQGVEIQWPVLSER
ncbi:MAG TPA: FAD-dependent oxidoreductase [Chthoniobacteraceae bacterium]|nr:FAD-dependent oxidoreductase [Chthoniobacteraceae bacterium]